MKVVKALIIKGNGINCENEMSVACQRAGAMTTLTHIRDFIDGIVSLNHYDFLLFPGGFSFGDDMGAAKALANRLKYSNHGQVFDNLHSFIQHGNLVLGVCNGFQLLLKLGLFSQSETFEAALLPNANGRFENRWCHHKVVSSHCVFTQGIDQLHLPIRHAEGQLRIKNWDQACDGMVALQYATQSGTPTSNYPDNPNGSMGAIAGLTDTTGRILGMMAHPEAAILPIHHPDWHRSKRLEGDGAKIFNNAIQWLINR